MPKEDKKRSVLEHAAAKTTPYEKMAPSASPTPPPSPGAEERAQEEWLQKKQVDLQKKIGKMEASVLAAQQTLAAGMDAESLLAYEELRHLGVENVFNTVEQAGVMSDSSSEDSDAESESEKSTEY